ncbi:MAG TPA: hypothetical protein VF457_10765 [Burkholderiaceae bacterium]
MHKTLTALFAASATVLCLGAHADDATRQADKQANAQYSAAKKRADANEDLNKAKCGSSWTRAGRACKSDASAEARKEKADAKVEQVNRKNANDGK